MRFMVVGRIHVVGNFERGEQGVRASGSIDSALKIQLDALPKIANDLVKL